MQQYLEFLQLMLCFRLSMFLMLTFCRVMFFVDLSLLPNQPLTTLNFPVACGPPSGFCIPPFPYTLCMTEFLAITFVNLAGDVQ